jgi:hypothetical protein
MRGCRDLKDGNKSGAQPTCAQIKQMDHCRDKNDSVSAAERMNNRILINGNLRMLSSMRMSGLRDTVSECVERKRPGAEDLYGIQIEN